MFYCAGWLIGNIGVQDYWMGASKYLYDMVNDNSLG